MRTLKSHLRSGITSMFQGMLLAVGLLACGQNSPAAVGPNEAPSQPEAAAAEADDPFAAAKRLALANVPGSGSIDQQLTAFQKAVTQQPKKTDAWIQLGRTWVSKARDASDPGFYLNAKACADV